MKLLKRVIYGHYGTFKGVIKMKYKQRTCHIKRKKLTIAMALVLSPLVAQSQFNAIEELSGINGNNGFVLIGEANNDNAGNAVSDAGDVNGDGLDDIIVGARFAGNGGKAYVVFGQTNGFPTTLNLSGLNGNNGFELIAASSNDSLGVSVSSAGDVNGDGMDDLIIGAYFVGNNGNNFSGSSYVLFGQPTFASSINVSSLNGNNGFVINGVAANDYSGNAVSGAGDINGDGIDDLIVGSPRSGPDENGSAYVVFGRNTFASPLNLSGLNGTNGFRLNGGPGFNRAGESVSGAGDFNGDGIDDLMIGSAYADGNGVAYVVFGHTGSFSSPIELPGLSGSNGFIINGAADGNRFGGSLSGAGDVNGDGIDDVIIGARRATPNQNREGSSYVIFGKTGSFTNPLDVSGLDGSDGFVINGIESYDRSGKAVSSAGDINGDGFADVIIGAEYAAPAGDIANGFSYVIFGKNNGFDPVIELSNLDGNNGFAIVGADEFEYSGKSVSSAGDVNGDGVDDIIIGAFGADDGIGAGYLLFGNDTIFKNGFE